MLIVIYRDSRTLYYFLSSQFDCDAADWWNISHFIPYSSRRMQILWAAHFRGYLFQALYGSLN